jgi:hypothetical protein
MKKALSVALISLFCFIAFSNDISALVGETTLMIYAIETNLESMNTRLEILSKTEAVKSGEWERMKDLIADVQNNDTHSLYWFANMDGSYYTVEKDLTDANLKQRAYFADLELGYSVYGAIVTGYTSGKRSAVAAVPVSRNGEVIGYLGGSKYVEAFDAFVAFLSENGLDKSFYVITTEGEEVFRYNINEKVSNILNDMMLANEFGIYPMSENSPLKYQYIFGPSPSTGWIYAIGSLK